MTTPENIANYGANVQPLLNELKKVIRAMKETGDVTVEESRRMQRALSDFASQRINIEGLQNRNVVGSNTAFQGMVDQLRAATQQADKLFESLNRVKNAPNLGTQAPGQVAPGRVNFGSAFGASVGGAGGPQPVLGNEIIASMRRHNNSIVAATHGEQVREAERQALFAQERAAARALVEAERQRVANLYSQQIQRAGQGGSGFGNDVRSGFFGGDNSGFGRSVGQAARFGLVYGAIYRVLTGVEQTLQFALTEAVDFQQGVTELALATDQSRDAASQLANNLADTANKYGIDSREGIQTGTKALGVFGVLDSSAVQQGAVARQATTAITQQAFLSGKDAQELTANTAAIAQAFGIGAESIGRITDTMTFFEKNFGIAAGSLSESMPAIASLAAQTGFSIENTAGLAAAVQSRTGGTAASASGLLSQILTREGEGTVQAIFSELNIAGKDFADQFRQLADILPTLSEQQRGRVAASFGRGRSQSAAIGLLEELDKVYALSGKASLSAAAGGSVGLTDQQAKQRLNDIGGQLAQLSGAFKGLVKELSQSGLLDALGGAVVGLRELAKVTTDILQVWNLLPNVVQDVLIAMALLAAANRLGATEAVANRFVGGLAKRGAYGGAEAVGGLGALRAIGARGAAGAALGAIGLTPATAAIAAVAISAGLVKGSFDALNAASQKANDALVTLGNTDLNSVESIKGARQELTKAAEERRNSAPGSFITDPVKNIVGLLTGESGKRASDVAKLESADAIASQLEKLLATRDARNNANTAGPTPFGDFSQDAISKGYDRLREKGYTAAQAMDQLSKSIDENASSAKARQALFDTETVALQTAIALPKQLRDFAGSSNLLQGTTPIDAVRDQLGIWSSEWDGQKDVLLTDIADELISSLPDAQTLFAALKPQLDAANADGNVTNEESRKIAESALNLGAVRELSKKYGADAIQQIIKALSLGGAEGIIAAGEGQDNAADINSTIANSAATVIKSNADRLSAVLEGDDSGLADALKANIASLNGLIEAERAQGNEVGDLLLDRVRAARQLQQAIVARDLHPAFLAAAQASAKAAGTTSTTDDQAAQVQQAAAELEKAYRLRGTAGGDIAYQNALENYHRAKLGQADSIKKEAESIKDLLGAQVGSDLAEATSSLRDAYKAMAAAETASEKNAAQIGLLNAQRAERQARLSAQSTRRKLNLDRTDPVQVAAEEARNARAEYEAERKAFTRADSAGGKKINSFEQQRLQELRLGIGDADANKQRAKFDQFNSDLQTNADLGKISRSSYLSAIDTEISDLTQKRSLLKKSDNMYRQYTDEINELANTKKGLQDALDGQFNLGDIQLPTPYEARRYAQSIAGGPGSFVGGSSGSVVNSNNTITLHGLTTDQMEAVLAASLGNGNTQTGAGYTP